MPKLKEARGKARCDTARSVRRCGAESYGERASSQGDSVCARPSEARNVRSVEANATPRGSQASKNVQDDEEAAFDKAGVRYRCNRSRRRIGDLIREGRPRAQAGPSRTDQRKARACACERSQGRTHAQTKRTDSPAQLAVLAKAARPGGTSQGLTQSARKGQT